MEQVEQDKFTEEQSLNVINEMLKFSKRRLRSDGILFLVWGWMSVISYYFLYYLPGTIAIGYWIAKAINFLKILLPILAILFTIYYLYQQSRRVSTYIGISIRYVWITVITSMALVNLIQFNVLGEIIFELQHPIFMILIAFGIIFTGSMIRYRLIIWGGAIFALLAYLSSFYPLQEQLLIEAIAWLIAFVIPGHILYAQRHN